MPLAVTCPSCSQLCQVEDQYAGMMVRCPKCGNIIQVPRPQAADGALPPVSPIPATSAPETTGSAGPGIMDAMRQAAASLGLDFRAGMLIYVGTGCFAAMVLATVLPWLSVPVFGGTESISKLGISLVFGWINIFFTVAAGGFVAAAFLALKKVNLFDYSLWSAAGWGLLASLWHLGNITSWGAQIGLYIELLASLGAAGTFGFVACQRAVKKA
jgi:hypothetical protein